MLVSKNNVNQIDVAVFKFLFVSRLSFRLKDVSRFVSKTGDGQLYIAVGLLLYLFEPINGRAFFFHALALFSVYLPIYLLLKQLFKRQRPCHSIVDMSSHITASDKFSMPSGHTSAATLMACLIEAYYLQWGALCFTWAGLIGISRVSLGVHYPTDILAGAGLSLLIAYIGLT